MKQVTIGLVCVFLSATGPATVLAHSDLIVGKDVADPSTGNLKIEFPFDEHLIGVDYTGFGSLFEASDPGFVPSLDEPLESIFEIDYGAEVELELTAVDPLVSVQVGIVTLDQVGEHAVLGTHTGNCSVTTATSCVNDGGCPLGETCVTIDPEISNLHFHPPFRLNLTPLAPDQFGEGRMSFRVKEGAGSAVGYGQSEIYTAKLSNGYLPAVDYGTGPVDDASSIACQKQVGSQVKIYWSKVYGYLKVCLDKVTDYKAKSAAGSAATATALAAAEKACADASGSSPDAKTMLGKIATAKLSAVSALEMKCGVPGATTITGKTIPSSASSDLSRVQIQTHLGMADCRAQELAGAGYYNSVEDLKMFNARASQGGGAISSHLSCLDGSQIPE